MHVPNVWKNDTFKRVTMQTIGRWALVDLPNRTIDPYPLAILPVPTIPVIRTNLTIVHHWHRHLAMHPPLPGLYDRQVLQDLEVAKKIQIQWRRRQWLDMNVHLVSDFSNVC